MLECRACTLRSIRALTGDIAKSRALARTPLLLTPNLSKFSFRGAASTAAQNEDAGEDVLLPGKQSTDDAFAYGTQDSKERLAIATARKRALNLELRWLEDPVKLAEHVHYTLRNNDSEKALDLCRLASKNNQVIVSWNHCVNWHMSRGKINEAIKIYNEMKKRAQFPDSFTYLLLLRGLAKPDHHGQLVKEENVAKAVSIYYSMSSPTSRVKPSIIHTNAVLKVCSAAIDMDALWGVVSKLPPNGPGAPDHITYSILLTAIRHGAFGKTPQDTYVERISPQRHQAVQEGRRIWQEIIPKWRAGAIHIDEELVCSMAKLLLISSSMQDWDHVLDLVRQTMNIDRQIAPLGSPDRKTEHVPVEHGYRNSVPDPEDSEGYKDAPSFKAFNAVSPLPPDASQPDRPTSLSWAQPGNAILSVLIAACAAMRIPRAATAYWNTVTSPTGLYSVKPDIANFHSQLGLLNKNRASAAAVKLVRVGMSIAGVTPKIQTFRIAMSVCLRDKNNHNSLDHARALVDLMAETCEYPDVHTLLQYLNLAMLTDSGPKVLATLERLDPIVYTLRSKLNYAFPEDQQLSRADFLLDKEDTIQLLRTMVGAMDTLRNRNLVSHEEFQKLHQRRTEMTKFIGYAMDRLARQRMRLGKAEEEKEGPGSKYLQRAEQRAGRLGRSGTRRVGPALQTFRWKDGPPKGIEYRKSRENETAALAAQ